MGKVSGEILRFWGNSGEIFEDCGEFFFEGVGHPASAVLPPRSRQGVLKRCTKTGCQKKRSPLKS